MTACARLTDLGSHGGTIVTASSDKFVNSLGCARLYDTYACPIHGPNPIISCGVTQVTNSRNTARVTAITACGATIVTGSPNMDIG
jgi:uncharacterized Zn-binding protein involved in type VI secretion